MICKLYCKKCYSYSDLHIFLDYRAPNKPVLTAAWYICLVSKKKKKEGKKKTSVTSFYTQCTCTAGNWKLTNHIEVKIILLSCKHRVEKCLHMLISILHLEIERCTVYPVGFFFFTVLLFVCNGKASCKTYQSVLCRKINTQWLIEIEVLTVFCRLHQNVWEQSFKQSC